MSKRPASLKRSPKSEAQDATEKEFRGLAARWHRDTDVHSSFSVIETHPAYQQIIAMGGRAVPFILRELEGRGGHWFKALQSITNENPALRGSDYEARRKAWLAWGRERIALS